MALNRPVMHADADSSAFENEDKASFTNRICTLHVPGLETTFEMQSKTCYQNTQSAGHTDNNCHGFQANDMIRDSLRQTLPQAKKLGQRAVAGHLFPARLHMMLSSAESQQFDHIVSWQPHGRCFKVHQPLRFVNEVMPTWFQHTKFTSFRRQLNLYGFSRLTTGADYSGYYHEKFLRGHSEACESIFRTRVKGKGIMARRVKQPNFYAMAPCNADSRNAPLEATNDWPVIPQNADSFIDSDNALNSEWLFDVSDHHSYETSQSQSDDTTSSTSRSSGGSSVTVYPPSLPSQPLGSSVEAAPNDMCLPVLASGCTSPSQLLKSIIVEASPTDMCLLMPASRCMSPMLASKESPHDKFGNELTFNGRRFHSLDPDLYRW